MNLTDQQILSKASKVLTEYKRKLRMEDAHVKLEVWPQSHEGKYVAPAECHHENDKGEYLIVLRRDIAAADSGKIIPYLVGHELAHAKLGPYVMLMEAIIGGKGAEARELLNTQAGAIEERLAHDLAVAIGAAPPPPNFWAGPNSNDAAALG
jgi:hypothetical protein